MRAPLRLDKIEARMKVMGKYGGIHSPVIYDPKNPNIFFVNGVGMTKADVDMLIKEDERQGIIIFAPMRLDSE